MARQAGARKLPPSSERFRYVGLTLAKAVVARSGAGARGANHQTGNRPSLIQERWPGHFIGTRKTRKNHLVTRENHLAVRDGDLVCQRGGRMKRHELAKVWLDDRAHSSTTGTLTDGLGQRGGGEKRPYGAMRGV